MISNQPKTQALWEHAMDRIPGGTQLLSKNPYQYAPGQWPVYASRSKGCEVWDLDGNHYFDMASNGIGSCLLGYADDDVTEAVIARIRNGSMSTLNASEEVELADRLCGIHPWAESVRFARTGGEICAVAVRIARATTGRDLVVISGYHGWADWYLAANLGVTTALDGVHLPGLKPKGVPRGLTGTALTFKQGDLEAFDKIIADYGDRLACVIMEPVRHEEPTREYLQHIKDACHRVGALLIFDEITIGWRLTFGGSHLKLGVTPDIAVFAKALGNGHPIAAVIGTKAAMDGANDSFISSTYWTEAVGPTAALAMIDKCEKTKVWEKIRVSGETVQRQWISSARQHGLNVTCAGIPCLAQFKFAEHSIELETLYTVLMLKRGFLANNAIYPTLAHDEKTLSLYCDAIDGVFAEIAAILARGGIEEVLKEIGGPVKRPGFARLIK